MESITIKKDGFYGNFSDYKKKKRKQWQKKLRGASLISALRHLVDIEDGVTFGDIIRAVNSSKTLTTIIGLYNNCDAKAHNESIINTPPDANTELEWIEVGWSVRIWGKFDNDLEMWTDCYGVGAEGSVQKHPEMGIVDKNARQHYAIDLTPANRLTNLPVKIKENFDMWLVEDKKSLKAKCSLTLLEFLDALYEEISFFGSPDNDRGKIVDQLCEARDNIHQQMEEGEALPFDEVNGMKIYLGDQVRETFGLPSNEEDRDDQIRHSAEE